jgi:hypothetical protein
MRRGGRPPISPPQLSPLAPPVVRPVQWYPVDPISHRRHFHRILRVARMPRSAAALGLLRMLCRLNTYKDGRTGGAAGGVSEGIGCTDARCWPSWPWGRPSPQVRMSASRAAAAQQPCPTRPHEPSLASPSARLHYPATQGFVVGAVVGIPGWHARGQGFKSPQLHQAQRISRPPSQRRLPAICQQMTWSGRTDAQRHQGCSSRAASAVARTMTRRCSTAATTRAAISGVVCR